MKIALIGATGFVGHFILQEAVARKHQVTALVRNPAKVPALPGVTSKALDLNNSAQLRDLVAGHDAVILSVHHGEIDQQAVIAAIKASGTPRLLAVGGAGSLEVAPGVQMVDTPEFPQQWHAMALDTRQFLISLRGEKQLDWTFLSPSAVIEPGERTGKFRLGKDQLLVNEQGESRISTQDYAVAMIDELENPVHSQQRFTVGY